MNKSVQKYNYFSVSARLLRKKAIFAATFS